MTPGDDHGVVLIVVCCSDTGRATLAADGYEGESYHDDRKAQTGI